MNVISIERFNKIKEKTILENAFSVICLYKYQFDEGELELKWLYERNKKGFVKTFKQKFPIIDDAEIENFMNIYLYPSENESGYFLFFCSKRDREWRITKYALLGYYLKEQFTNANYG